MRKFMLGAALASSIALAGCTAAQIEAASTTVENDIQAGTAALCGIVPTLPAITSVAGVLFPGIASITEVAIAGETAIEKEICSAAPPAASMKFKALPQRSSSPAVIGTTAHGVPVAGWRAQ